MILKQISVLSTNHLTSKFAYSFSVYLSQYLEYVYVNIKCFLYMYVSL